jgi:hypothetical protein
LPCAGFWRHSRDKFISSSVRVLEVHREALKANRFLAGRSMAVAV